MLNLNRFPDGTAQKSFGFDFLSVDVIEIQQQTDRGKVIHIS